MSLHDPKGTYAQHIGVCLCSVFANVSRPVEAHLLHDETLIETNRQRFDALAAQFGQRISYHDASVLGSGIDLKTQSSVSFLSPAAVYRLFLPEILPDLSRAIYLDADMVVDMDLAEMWDQDLRGLPLGGIPDLGVQRALYVTGRDATCDLWANGAMARWRELDIPLERYFNSGSLLMDLDAIRRDKLFAATLDFIERHPNLPCLDQDALNAVFRENYTELPFRFNIMLSMYPTWCAGPCIWHYTGDKPWNSGQTPRKDRYEFYLNHTPWRTVSTAEPDKNLITTRSKESPMLFDCFPFFNEFDLLEMRLETLDHVVDKFILVEATKTFTNKDKPLYFYANRQRFAKWLHKIHYHCVDVWPEYTSPWIYESLQRNSISAALAELNPSPTDTVMVSDVDEIPNPEAIKPYIGTEGMYNLEMTLHHGFINSMDGLWYGPYLISYAGYCHFLDNVDFPDMVYAPAVANQGTTATRLRMLKRDYLNIPCIPQGGWHFSSLGSLAQVVEKHQSTSWAAEPTFQGVIQQLGAAGAMEQRAERITAETLDIPADRFVRINESHPQCVRENPKKWARYIHSYPYLAD